MVRSHGMPPPVVGGVNHRLRGQVLDTETGVPGEGAGLDADIAVPSTETCRLIAVEITFTISRSPLSTYTPLPSLSWKVVRATDVVPPAWERP